MIEIHRSALVLVQAKQLYHLINDIEAYPQFLDGIASASVIDRSETQMLGQLVISKAGFERTIVTRNTLQAPTLIEMNLEQGPLEYLNGIWQIKPLDEQGCRVSLDLRFSAMKGLKGMAFNHLFKQVADGMVDSFVSKAHELYS
ncbi:MAG: type II toxin-antitoxin system RatA family toxin [Reinekea sp.]